MVGCEGVGMDRAARRKAIRRDDSTCQKCGSPVVASRGADGTLAHVHHKHPRARGGGDELSNLVTLCEDCHADEHPHHGVGAGYRGNPWITNSPEDLNETDIAILRLLSEGRETRGSLADSISKHENYVGERLRWLRAYELVSWYHEPTALYEITDKGREWLDKV